MQNINEVIIRNAAGDLEVIDILTGEVVHSSAKPLTTVSSYSFNYHTAMYICQLVKQGKTMKQVCEEDGMPPLEVLSHWQRMDRMFAEELKIARRERAEFYHDQAMDIATKAAHGMHKDEVPAASLAAKIYQWGAEKAKPDSYGAKVTHEGSETKPILMRIVNTGISRAKPDVVVAETIEVTDVKNTNTDPEDQDD